MGRAPCCEKVGLKKGRWATEEDQLLIKFIKDNGEGSWRSLPKKAGLLRCGKSCRLRWINYLREDLKRGNISMEEEETIIKLRATLGNRWSLIAGHLPGRTDNEIKNYWNSHLSKRVQGSHKNKEEPNACDKIPRKRRGGRPSKSIRKKDFREVDSIAETANNQNVNEKSSKNEEILAICSQSNQQNQTSPPKDAASSNTSEGRGVEAVYEGIPSLEEIEKLVDWDLEEIASKVWEREGIDDGKPLILEDDCEFFGGIYENGESGVLKDFSFDNWQINCSVAVWP